MKPRIIYIGIAIIAFFSFAAPICYFDMERDNPNDPYNRNPELVQLFKLVASDGIADDYFAKSVSISSDGSTIVVGAYGDNSEQGSAYVFTKSGGNWIQAAKLTAFDGAEDDCFGESVSISSDGSVIVVGAEYDDLASADQGSAYVFVRPGGGWVDATEDAKLTASDGALEDNFGFSVSISSDGTTIVVGAPFDDDNGSLSGSAYVFVKPGGGWINNNEDAKLTAFDGAAGDNFGFSVSISSDGSTIVVGASGDDTGKGSAYVFLKGGGWSTTSAFDAKLTASDGVSSDWFGWSVSISSDGSTIVVGAYGDGSYRGSAYVFLKGAGWETTSAFNAKLTASDGAANDFFGISVSISSDGSIIIVGAPRDDVTEIESGSSYVFLKGAGWADKTQDTKLVASDGGAYDHFGRSVSISSDGSTIIVGAHKDDFSQGSAYVFGYGY